LPGPAPKTAPKPLQPKVASLAPERAFMLVRADLPRTSPRTVFDRWSSPALLTLWWPEVAELELRVGGKYHFAWPRADWHLRGSYVTVREPNELGFSWRWDHHPESTTVVKVTIEPGVVAGSTVMVRQGPYSDSPQDIEMRQSHIDGWLFFLPRLETQFLRRPGNAPAGAAAVAAGTDGKGARPRPRPGAGVTPLQSG
jgi:uncharacterized protein YndB with AHSA1/START domain